MSGEPSLHFAFEFSAMVSVLPLSDQVKLCASHGIGGWLGLSELICISGSYTKEAVFSLSTKSPESNGLKLFV